MGKQVSKRGGLFSRFGDGALALVGLERRSQIWDSETARVALSELLGLVTPTAAGETVTPSSALGLPAIWSAVRLLSDAVAMLPLHVYRMKAGGERERDREHALNRVLNKTGNSTQVAFKVRQALTASVVFYGNGYAEIERRGDGQVVALWPLPPWEVSVDKRRVGRLDEKIFTWTHDGAIDVLPQERCFHLEGFGFSGAQGLSPVSQCRESIGVALAQECFVGGLAKNGARLPGFFGVQNEYTMSNDQVAALQTKLSETLTGARNAGKTPILEGVDWKSMGSSAEDAQTLEQRQFSIQDIARQFKVPPHMLGELSRATFANITAQNMHFLQYSLKPWLVLWEQSVEMHLLPPREVGRVFVEHVTDAFLEMDPKAQNEAFAVGLGHGFLTLNEVRKLKNLPALAAEVGDIPYMPANMVKASDVGKVAPADKAPTPVAGSGEPT